MLSRIGKSEVEEWLCTRCRRLFVWATDPESIQPGVIAHLCNCNGDAVAEIANENKGEQYHE